MLLASAVLRIGVALGGFYLVAGGDWARMLLCLLGFLLARLAVTWATRLPSPATPHADGGPPCALAPTSGSSGRAAS